MKVIVVGTDLNPPLIEGIRNTTYEIYERLTSDLDICFVTKGYKGMSLLSRFNGIKIYRVPTTAKHGYIAGREEFVLKIPYYLKNIIKKEYPDIIHVHSSFSLLNAYICYVAKISDASLLTVNSVYSSAFNVDPYEEQSMLKHIGNLVAKRPSLLRHPIVNATIVMSKKAYNVMKKYGIRNIVYFPHIAINTKRFHPDLKCRSRVRDELNIDYDDIVILFGGDLSPTKGIEIFLYALQILLKKNRAYESKLKILILNKGIYEKNSIRARRVTNIIRKLNLAKFIKFVGVRRDIECIINAADIIVFPFTKNYGFMDIPRTLLEAMSCGKTVVVSNIGAVEEYVINRITGFYIMPNNIRELANILLNIANNEEIRQQIGLQARALVNKLFSADKVSKQMLQFYRELLNSN